MAGVVGTALAAPGYVLSAGMGTMMASVPSAMSGMMFGGVKAAMENKVNMTVPLVNMPLWDALDYAGQISAAIATERQTGSCAAAALGVGGYKIGHAMAYSAVKKTGMV